MSQAHVWEVVVVKVGLGGGVIGGWAIEGFIFPNQRVRVGKQFCNHTLVLILLRKHKR